MTRTPMITAAALVVVALTVAGCDSRSPGPDASTEITSDEARAAVVAAADAAKAALEDAFLDAGFVAEPQPGGPAQSWDCSDSPAADGDAIEWASKRSWYLESRELTAPMLDPLVEDFTTDGWEVSADETDEQRLVTLERDDYMIEIAGDSQLSGDAPTRIRVAAYSPCLDNPDQ